MKYLVSALLSFLVLGCGSGVRVPELPETSLLMRRDRVALVRVEYARFHQEPAMDSAVIGHARAGAILLVEERTPDLQWFRSDLHAEGEDLIQGWVHLNDVDLYDNRAQARNAREREESGE